MPVQTTTTTRADRDNGHGRAILEIETAFQLQEEKIAMRKQRVIKENKKFSVEGYIRKIKNYLSNRIFLGILVIILIGVTIPALIFYLTIDGVQDVIQYDTCSVLPKYRVSCGLPNVTNPEYCTRINCCYSNDTAGCFHYVPSRYYYFDPKTSVWSLENPVNFRSNLDKTPYWIPSLPQLRISIAEENENYLIIYLDKSSSNPSAVSPNTTSYEYNVNTTKMYVDVWRKRVQTGDQLVPILTTKLGPTIASENYLEWTIDLSADRLFGLGNLQLPDNEIRRKVIYPNAGDHQTAATLMAFNSTTQKFHGLNIKNDGLLDITVLPSKIIHVRSLFSNKLELHLFMGPKPSDVSAQYRSMSLEVVNFVPPYWTLGVHICRDGITSLSSALDEHRQYLENTTDFIPFDSDCIHENIFTNPLSLSQENKTAIAEAVRGGNVAGKKFIMTLSPQLAINESNLVYKNALETGILYSVDKDTVYTGKYKNLSVAYPDFSMQNASLWLETDYLQSLWNTLEEFDSVKGLVLRDNWPADEGFVLSPDTPLPVRMEAYFDEVNNSTLNFTLPWYTVTTDPATANTIEHSTKHCSYGSDHAKALKNSASLVNSTDFFLSASYSQDTNYGTHVQNVNITWLNLRQAVEKSLYHSVFGGSSISVPVCGTTGFYNALTHEQLCTRWYQVAATLPMFRISSDWPRRDPLNLATKFATQIALNAINLRYSLLPYFYTALQTGVPLVRPFFYSFPEDAGTFDVQEQYMLGDALLVATPLWPDLPVARFYLPDAESLWFEYWGGMEISRGGKNISLPVINTDLVLLLRSGYVVPIRNSINDTAMTAEDKRLNNPLDLLVALNCGEGTCEPSKGSLHIQALVNGEISFESPDILFESTDTQLTFYNHTLFPEICSNANLPEEATLIRTVYLYGKQKNNRIKISVNRNLCNLSADPYIFNFTLPISLVD